MKARLIHYSTGAAGTEYEGKSLDEIIVGIARVSSSRETNELFKDPAKLLRHCLLNGHWSVFTTVNIGIEITTSRAIGRQILRHKSFEFQEFSQRYATAQGFEDFELRVQSKSNRQSSSEILENAEMQRFAQISVQNSLFAYENLLKHGASRETARNVLTEATTSVLFINGNIRSFITYLNARLHKTTELPHRLIAHEVAKMLIEICPIISEMLYNFENAENIHLLDRLILEKYKVYDKVVY